MVKTHTELSNCEHCGEQIVIPTKLKWQEREKLFCCNGCKTVYQILHEKGLENYYKLKESSGTRDQLSPIKDSEEQYQYLDHQEFLDKYAKHYSDHITIDFFIEGVHCVACLWLIEKLPDFMEDVIFSKLNMSKSIVTVSISKNGKLSAVAKQLALLGYRPHPILNKQDAEKLLKKEDRAMLIRMAIAFTCAGNIMLLSFSIYGGATGELAKHFNWYSFFLMFPILFYSATPFYKSAYSAIKNKILSIDIPIVVALLFGTISGLYNLIYNIEHLYFDSLSILIFLLLTARFVLKKSQQKSLSTTEIASFFANSTAHIWNEQTKKFEDIHAQFLKRQDKILVKSSEMIPADGIVLEGSSTINNSLLTGESLPINVSKNKYVYSGTTNIDNNLIIQVLNTKEETRLGKILKNVEAGWNQKADIVTFADTVAKYFVLTVFFLAFLTFVSILYLNHNFEDAFTRALTLIIITCPCALGLTTPLALTLTLGNLAKKGMIIKNERVIEKLAKANEIFLDKTGTLTYGNFQISDWQDSYDLWKNYSIIYHLEKKSKHPIAKAINNFIKSKYFEQARQIPELVVENYKEFPGKGVCGYIDNKKYYIRTIKEKRDSTKTWVGLFLDETVMTKIALEDKIRPDALEVVTTFDKLGLKTTIISGDAKGPVKKIANQLGLNKENYRFEVSPEEKSNILEEHKTAIMVGDGANDAIALSKAFVGVAVKGSVDISLRAADIYLSQSGIKPVLSTIIASTETLKVIKRNLAFSLIYNVIGATLAILGYITPLFAAILMPLSSITVLISTLLSTNKLKRIFSTN